MNLKDEELRDILIKTQQHQWDEGRGGILYIIKQEKRKLGNKKKCLDISERVTAEFCEEPEENFILLS